MTDTLQQVLDTPGCERLKDFVAVGPAQRAALELFVDRLRAAEDEPVQWLDVIGAVGRGWRRTGNTRKQMDPDLAFAIADEVKALYTAPLKAAPEATQYIALCDAMGYNERTDSLTSPEEHAKSLVAEIKRLSDAHRDELLAEIKRLKEQAAPMTADDYKAIREAFFNMLKQFTKTPSTGADSEARIAGHKALAALEKYKPKE